MAEQPGGEVTFLFTDIEGSTRRWEAFPDAMNRAVARHDALLRASIEAEGGTVFKTIGDAFCAAFATPDQGLAAALSAQMAVAAEDWAEVAPLRVRMALHTGAVRQRDNDYFGPTVNRVARLLGIGHGGQTLISGSSHALLSAWPDGSSVVDMGEHRLKDLQRAEHVFQVNFAGLPTQFAALKSLNRRNHNLPVNPTPLLGRDAELAAVLELLRGAGVRLVTLTGPGGTGKTSLSLQAAAEALDTQADGVYFVPLEAARDAESMVGAMALALEQKELTLEAFITLLNGSHGGRDLLLVLDNFEQVAHASAAIGRILAACPRVKFLATSRAPLRLRGEREFPLPPLALPPAKTPLGLGAIATFPAIDLFVQRAQAAKPNFDLTAENMGAVTEICRRLDGLPLAIELAAARVKMLAPAAMLGYLDNRLKLLTGGARDLPERQRTLRGAIDWSYDMLPAAEAELFCQLAVFAGGWTLEAALEVCRAQSGSPGELDFDVFEGLSSLAEKSLVRQVDQAEGVRFSMLGTIREYALEQLGKAGGPADLPRRHAQYFAELAGLLAVSSSAIEPRAFEAEHDNWRAALDWLLGTEAGPRDGANSAQAASLALLLADYWERSGRYSEARDYLGRFLSRVTSAEVAATDSGTDVGVATRLQGLLGWFSYLQADYTAAIEWQTRSLQGARAAADAVGQSNALNNLALISHAQGDLTAAHGQFETALQLARDLGDRAKQAARLSNLGLLCIEEESFAQARLYLEEAAATYQALRDDEGSAACACNLAELELRLHHWDDATRHAERGLQLFRALGDRRGIVFTLTNSAEAALGREQWKPALTLLREAIATAWEAELLWILPALLQLQARGYVGAGEWQKAADALAAAGALPGADESGLSPLFTEIEIQSPGTMTAAQSAAKALDTEALVARALHETEL